jgi:putative transcriptional regulator
MGTPASSSSLRGHFLIALPSLQDGFFSHAVTYLCEHNEEGAMGLVINQMTDLGLHALLRQVDIDPMPDLAEQPVFRGGPVQPEHGFVLHSPERSWVGTRSVGGGLALTTSRDILEDMASGRGPEQALVALGYAGWGPGQLESELAENAWLVAPVNPSVVFALAPGERWGATAQLIGIDVNLISQVAGHA